MVQYGETRETRLERAETDALRHRFESLTPREHEVLELIAAGLLNRQAAGELGIDELTIKAHRAGIMRKMQAQSLAELVHMVDRLKSSKLDGRFLPK
jgi:FixJ family two-component response regulator